MGGVSVEKELLGLSQAPEDANFPVWTVTFDGECSFAEGVWASCPANIGDLEVYSLSSLSSDIEDGLRRTNREHVNIHCPRYSRVPIALNTPCAHAWPIEWS